MTAALATVPAELHGRAQFALTQIAEAWRRDTHGTQYVEALKTFLFGLPSRNTRAQYSRSINEFFEWYEREKGRIPVPGEVRREDAIKYADWLRTRTVGLEEHRLKKDTTRRLDLAIYRLVKASPGIRVDTIRGHLLASPEFTVLAKMRPNAAAASLDRVLKIEEASPDGLDRHLGCLVSMRVLERSPSIDDIRMGRFIVPGLDIPSRAQIEFRVPEMTFAYRVAAHDEPTGAGRASTIKIRLTALKSFWSYLIRSGENVRGMTDPLLKYNIWEAGTAQASREAKAQQAVSRSLKTPDMEIFNRLLGTTYRTSSEDGMVLPSRDLEDIRDRAILLFLLYIASRAEELVTIQRTDVVWGPEPLVSILGKGQKKRLVRIPDPAYQAVLDLTAKLEELADQAERSRPTEIAPARRLLAPDAPLFPPTSRWGCNADINRRKELPPILPALDRTAIYKMLHRRAEETGFARGSHEFTRSHPHGFRHLAAQLARDAGTPLPIIQAVLGHSSLSTTGTYTEARDPNSVILFGWSPPQIVGGSPAAPPGAPIPPPTARPIVTPAPPTPERPRPPVKVVQTVGTPVPEPIPAARPPAPHDWPVALPPPPPLPPDPEPMPDVAPPPEERLVAVGATPESLFEEDQRRTAAELDRIYETNWGEARGGEQLRTGKKVPGDEAYDTLIRTTAGRRSGLVWWAGPTGRLQLSMPVMSPGQVIGEETVYGSVRERLGELWTHWMDLDDDARGPTAAFALLAWVRDALEVSYDVASEVEVRQGEWIGYLAPIEATARTTGKRRIFREHRDDRIADWFGTTAWQHRISRGRTATGGRPPRVVDTVLDVPAWYQLADPLAELSDADRRDLFDWIRVLTGRPPVDPTVRYKGASRKDIGGLIGLMCTYDANRAELRRAQHAGEREALRDLKHSVEQDREAVNLVVQSMRNLKFDIRAAVDERVQGTRQRMESESIRKAAGEEDDDESSPRERREGNRKFYLRVIGDLFGPEAAADDILALFAYCNQEDAPLSGWLYPQLFHIQGKTIVHSPEFAKQFARETGGAHSECVARRMARELWELRQKQREAEIAGSTAPRLIQRPDELLEWLHAMAFFKIPCPRELETELRERIADRTPVPVYEEWQRWRQQIEERFSKERSAVRAARAQEQTRHVGILEEFGEAAEKYREAVQRDARATEFEPNARAKEYRYQPNMRRFVPSPVALLFCVYAR
jgi:integrase